MMTMQLLGPRFLHRASTCHSFKSNPASEPVYLAGAEMLAFTQHSLVKKRSRTVLCWAEAFKEKEEEKYFERIFIMAQRGMLRFDNNQQE
jgi:hypothetical protein